MHSLKIEKLSEYELIDSIIKRQKLNLILDITANGQGFRVIGLNVEIMDLKTILDGKGIKYENEL